MTTILLGRICRTCLKKSVNMRKLSEFVNDELQVEDMLNQTIPNFDMGIEDIPLPVEICKDCLFKLQTSHDFVQMCLKSNNELKNVLNQQKIEKIDVKLNVMPELSEETDTVLEVFKEEPDDNNSNVRQQRGDDCKSDTKNFNANVVKLEAVTGNESHHEDNCSSDEYWTNDDQNQSDSYIFERITKSSLDIKPKSKYCKKVHVKRVSTKVCLHCNKAFQKKNLLTKHLTVHDPVNQYVCDICEYRFSSEAKLQHHLSLNHKGVDVTLSGSQKDYKCEVCNMNLKTMGAVTRHMNCKHPEFLPYKCNLCEKSFPVENHLKAHLNEHMGYKKYKCDFCEKSFIYTSALKDHVRVHTGESPFLCNLCGKSFKTANIFRLHLQRHGEKKFHCPECPMKFYVKLNLTQHMFSHSKLKQYSCDICGSSFTRQDSLKVHKFIHSGERPFKCDDCNMSFVFKKSLKRHKLTHTGEKPHMCNFCDRAYAASGDLVKHMRTHVGEKTYFCDQCPESFKYSHDLRNHKNLHYREKLNVEERQQKM